MRPTDLFGGCPHFVSAWKPYMRVFNLLSVILLGLSPVHLHCGKPANAAENSPATENPNVLVILVDDMGYGDAQCFNPDSKIPTPNINALAKAGMRFTDAHAPGPLCHMSRYGLMTGRFPFRTDVSRWPRHALIDANQPTVASMMRDHGYRTAMIGKWHLGFEEQGYDQPLPGGPADRGFDSFFGIRASTDIPPYFYIRDRQAVSPPSEQIAANRTDGWSPIQGEFWREGGIAPNLKLHDVLPRFTDEAIQVIASHSKDRSDTPLFLYLAYPAPHTPWLPSKEFRGKSGAGMYGEFAMMVDHMIGRVLQSLEDAGMAENTLVLFTSDNGPVWYEEDVQRYQHDSSGGLRGMKADAWECGHRMPFIVRWPGKVEADSTNDQLICFTDLMATLADVIGQPLAKDAGPDSFSFFSGLVGKKPQSRSSLAMRASSGVMTLRKGQWKLITGLGSGGFSKPKRVNPGPGDPPGQLYDLEEDLGETVNLYTQYPEIVSELTEELERIQSAKASRLID